ncbi:MAG: hypothetical protein JXQ74_03675 [Alphaproteobacteria bacterium]|nr:hypothetical protein [Alphaproteobacteria bacterium]
MWSDILDFINLSSDEQLHEVSSTESDMDLRKIFSNTQYDNVARAAILKMSKKSRSIQRWYRFVGQESGKIKLLSV